MILISVESKVAHKPSASHNQAEAVGWCVNRVAMVTVKANQCVQ